MYGNKMLRESKKKTKTLSIGLNKETFKGLIKKISSASLFESVTTKPNDFKALSRTHDSKFLNVFVI